MRLAVAAEVGSARRAWIHRRAAEVLAQRPDANPLELARHARECGDLALAAASLVEASDLALARLDLAGAERLLDEAIGFDDRAPLRLRRSRVRMSRGDLDGADADAEHAMATDDTGEALELRAWAARNRHDLDGAVRLGRAAATAATDPTIRASSLIAVAFGHRGNGDLRAAESVLEEAVDAPDELGLPAWAGVLRVHQGRPSEALATLEPMLGAEARRGTQGFWVEHTLQMTAHAYGLLGRSADALRVLDRLEREIERRGTTVRYAGVQHTYRSWLLRNLGDLGAEDLALQGLELAGSQEILAQCHLDVADCLLRTGGSPRPRTGSPSRRPSRAPGASTTSGASTSGAGLLLARLGLAEREPAAALEAAESVAAAAEERGDQRYAVLGRLVRATALGRLGETVDLPQVTADLSVARRGRGARGLVAGRRRRRRDRAGAGDRHRHPARRPRRARGGSARGGVPRGGVPQARLTLADASGDGDRLDHPRREPGTGAGHGVHGVGHELGPLPVAQRDRERVQVRQPEAVADHVLGRRDPDVHDLLGDRPAREPRLRECRLDGTDGADRLLERLQARRTSRAGRSRGPPRPVSTASFAEARSAENVDTRTTPPGRVTRRSSRSPATGSGRWLTTKAATTASNTPSRNGRPVTSAATAGPEAATCAAMSGSRSAETTRAPSSRSARPATPEPAPASRARTPSTEPGSRPTRCRASGS